MDLLIILIPCLFLKYFHESGSKISPALKHFDKILKLKIEQIKAENS